MSRLTVLQGDWVERLKELPNGSVHCCVTSPPYYSLRDYGVAGQLGLEKSAQEYVTKLVDGFRELRRVLRGDGTLWLNLGDSYSGGGNYRGINSENTLSEKQNSNRGARGISQELGALGKETGCKPKDMIGIPWMVAFALRDDGWYLRSDIIWHKPNPMPESVTDRPTKSHEYLFLLSKSQRYFYDSEAIKEPLTTEPHAPGNKMNPDKVSGPNDRNGHSQWETSMDKVWGMSGTRNKRSVWTVATAPYSEAHFATFPPDLIKPCILAGTSAKGCCPHCGAPWERVVETSPMEIRRSDRGNKVFGNNHSTAASGTMTKPPETRTTGWQPTCDCGYGELNPCTVLDPFAGSGTTGMVALELGRKAILIELSEAYCKLLKDRTNVTPGLPLA